MPQELVSSLDPSPPAPLEPVVAELVPATPPPWRFGLRAMMGLTAVCCLQFALMNWFGVMYGLLAAIAICFLAFSGVFVVAVLLVRGNSLWIERLDQVGIRLVIALAVLIVGSILAGGGKIASDQLGRVVLTRQLEHDLGLSMQRAQVVQGSNVVYGLEVTRVTVGGVADKAGLRQADVILVEDTTDEFLRQLNRQRGKDVSVNVAAGAADQVLENCPQRQVTLPIPGL